MKKALANKKGFTAIEVEIVIVIVLVIICVFVGAISYRNSKIKADAVACSVTRGRVATAVSQAKLNGNSEIFPNPIGELDIIFTDNKFFDGCFEIDEQIICPNGGIISFSIKTHEIYCPVHNPMPENENAQNVALISNFCLNYNQALPITFKNYSLYYIKLKKANAKRISLFIIYLLFWLTLF